MVHSARPRRFARRLTAIAALVAGTAGLADSAAAASFAGGTYQLRAYVPVACWVKPSSPVAAQAGSQGQVVEACNAPGGFTVTASYRPLSANEQARLQYGAATIELSQSGQQVLGRSNLATIRSVNYRFEAVSLHAPLVLALTIQPI